MVFCFLPAPKFTNGLEYERKYLQYLDVREKLLPAPRDTKPLNVYDYVISEAVVLLLFHFVTSTFHACHGYETLEILPLKCPNKQIKANFL